MSSERSWKRPWRSEVRGALCRQRQGVTIRAVTPRRYLAAAAFALVAASACDRFATDPGLKVVAEVGTESVTVSELQAFLDTMQLQDPASDPVSPGDLARVKSRLFDDFLEAELLYQEALRREVTVSDAELAAYLGGDASPVPAARELARRDLMIQKLRESVALAAAHVDDTEIDTWIAAQAPLGEPALQGTLRTLRLASYPEAARVRREILAKKLSFAEAGQAYGADSLPDAPRDEDLEALPPHIATAVKALSPGSVSLPLPFESSVLLFLLEKADDPSESMSRRREIARREIALDKAQAAVERLLRELRGATVVTRHPGELPFSYVAEDAVPRAR